MNDFWESIVGSASIVNSTTIISLPLAIIFFIYQEYRTRRSHAREVLRLRDEITSLIIRNHVNNEVHVSKIDLQVIISRFEIFKNCRLKMSNIEIIKIVYAKVYENEHISNVMRLQLLKELEEIMNSYEIGLIESNELVYQKEPFINTRLSASISMILF